MTDNPAVAAIAKALATENVWPPHTIAEWVLDALLACPEALRWLGRNVTPEALGYDVHGWFWRGVWHAHRPPDIRRKGSAFPVYLAPRREEATS